MEFETPEEVSPCSPCSAAPHVVEAQAWESRAQPVLPGCSTQRLDMPACAEAGTCCCMQAVSAVNTFNGTDLAGRKIMVREDREDRDVKQYNRENGIETPPVPRCVRAFVLLIWKQAPALLRD